MRQPSRLRRRDGRAFAAAVLALAVAALFAAGGGGNRAGSAAAAADPVIAAAGDIACDPGTSSFNGGNGTSNSCHQKATSNILVNGGFAAVLPLGDNQYYCGGYSAFLQSYDPSWGRVKSISHPVVGNHEYLTSGGTDCTSANAGADGYFKYFGTAAGQKGKGYYSYDVGAWHVVALNSNCGDAGGCSASSPQGQWLQADLAAHTNVCTLAYWHIPLFSSGGRASSNTKALWQILYDTNADLVLTGHDHIYERFAPQRADGTLDNVRGLREFVVGTGGANHTNLASTAKNSQVRNDTTYGILALTLHATSYDWQFQPEPGATFTDSGTSTCHGSTSDVTPPSAPTNLAATASAPNRVDLSWTASTDDIGVAGYRVYRDGTQVGTTTQTTYSDTTAQPNTTYSYTVSAYDAGLNASQPSSPASATTPSDTQPPTAPTQLHATSLGATEVDLAWTTAGDDVGVARYLVSRDGTQIGQTTTTSFSDPTVQPQTSYEYSVVAVDAGGNSSPPSTPLDVTTPSLPTTLTLRPTADTYVEADTPSTNYGSSTTLIADNSPIKNMLLKFQVSGVAGRHVAGAKLRLYCVDPSPVGGAFHRVADTSWSELGVTWNTAPAPNAATIASLGAVAASQWYEVDVTSVVTGDGTYALSAASSSSDGAHYSSKEGTAGFAPQLVLTIDSGAPDTSSPTQPAGLSADTSTPGVVALSWTASSDDVGVTGYTINRDGTDIGTSIGTSFSDTTVQPSTTYTYRVTAHDAAGNSSPPSDPLQVTTPAGPTTITLTPAADTFVEQDMPSANFGSLTSVQVDNSPVKNILLTFTVSGTSGKQVTSAKLRLRCVDPSTSGGDFRRITDTSWSEQTVTWSTAPAGDPTTFASLASVSSGVWYEVNVPFITGDGTYSIRITSTSTNGADYSSKEGSFAPQLVLSLG